MTTVTHQPLSEATRIVALTTAQGHLPMANASAEETAFLAGIGMLVAELDGDDWTFGLHIALSSLDQDRSVLVLEAAQVMRAPGHVVGWQLAQTSIPALLTTAGEVAPQLAHAMLDDLAKLLACGSTDLAVDHGGAGAPEFGAYAEALGLPVRKLGREALFEAWQTGEMAPVGTMIASELLAIMHLALLAAGPAKASARRDLGRWLAWQRRLGTDL
ncbi:hypothetical protein [Sphingomonas profundi]|uniref:hypothetical protein n=1 Tax=Alterirhizorhabdus profundi TaxID=2681549 RepID=UPI0012E73858|nr:hypothetical protein [Sphingomonas profundi]